jgi:Saxitoxin biosynthesis operon protein SxtJ
MPLVAIDAKPSASRLRLFAGLWFPLFFALVGLRIWRITGSLAAAGAVWGATVCVSFACLAFLPLARLLYVGLMALTFPLGYVFSHVVLGAVFFGVLTPAGLLLRIFGFDPMQRTIDRSAKSYWTARATQTPIERYFRQY